jgi:hypothetical protein
MMMTQVRLHRLWQNFCKPHSTDAGAGDFSRGEGGRVAKLALSAGFYLEMMA